MPKNAVVIEDRPETPTRTHVDGQPVLRSRRELTPTLIRNEAGAYKFVPREVAENMEANHAAIIMRPSDPDYVKATKLAVGVFGGFKKGEVIQVGGEAVRPQDIGAFDSDAVIQAAEMASSVADPEPPPSFRETMRDRKMKR